MTTSMIDLTKILILEPTNEEICKYLKERVNILKVAISTSESKEDKACLIDDIDKLTVEVISRLIPNRDE